MSRGAEMQTDRLVRSLRIAAAVTGLLLLSGCSTLHDFAAPVGTPSATPTAVDRHHWHDERFTGTITGYSWAEDPSSDSPTRVMVDQAVVDLDLIWTYAAACRDGVDEAKALAVKQRLLPVGRRVTVVRSDPDDEVMGFITSPMEEGDPQASVNEALVRSGYWAPSGFAFNGTEVQYGDARRYVLQQSELTSVQRVFAPAILVAGNRTRAARTGGQLTCVRQVLAHRRSEKTAWAEIDRDIEETTRRQQEYARTHPGGSCADGSRDGDGDGICHEG